MSWQPILQGVERERALAAVHAVADALREPPEELRGGDLAGGDAGIALLWTYLADAEIGISDAGDLAAHYVERAMDSVASSPMAPALHGGFSGVAWAIQHLRDRLFEQDGEDPCEDIDQVLLDLVSQPAPSADFDLISGLSGLGVYGLERRHTEAGRAILHQLVARFGELAEHSEQGATWFSGPHLLPDHQRKHHPDGYYNMGLAHGVPAVVNFLGQCAGLGIDAAAPLYRDSARWLLAQEQADDVGSHFCWAFAKGEPPSPCRMAWCYGDAGVFASLHVAAQAAGDPATAAEAVRLGASSAARPPDTAGVVDAGLCHGSAGLALIFQRMWSRTGQSEFADAARYWANDTLARRQPGKFIGGFSVRMPAADDQSRMVDKPDPGLLSGSAGVALALLAACTEIEPRWDRTLMLSSV